VVIIQQQPAMATDLEGHQEWLRLAAVLADCRRAVNVCATRRASFVSVSRGICVHTSNTWNLHLTFACVSLQYTRIFLTLASPVLALALYMLLSTLTLQQWYGFCDSSSKPELCMFYFFFVFALYRIKSCVTSWRMHFGIAHGVLLVLLIGSFLAGVLCDLPRYYDSISSLCAHFHLSHSVLLHTCIICCCCFVEGHGMTSRVVHRPKPKWHGLCRLLGLALPISLGLLSRCCFEGI
jgi:hypothetical protein